MAKMKRREPVMRLWWVVYLVLLPSLQPLQSSVLLLTSFRATIGTHGWSRSVVFRLDSRITQELLKNSSVQAHLQTNWITISREVACVSCSVKSFPGDYIMQPVFIVWILHPRGGKKFAVFSIWKESLIWVGGFLCGVLFTLCNSEKRAFQLNMSGWTLAC